MRRGYGKVVCALQRLCALFKVCFVVVFTKANLSEYRCSSAPALHHAASDLDALTVDAARAGADQPCRCGGNFINCDQAFVTV